LRAAAAAGRCASTCAPIRPAAILVNGATTEQQTDAEVLVDPAQRQITLTLRSRLP